MKCPNCSFNNASTAEICKVCGFEFNAPKEPKTIVVPQVEDDQPMETDVPSAEDSTPLDEPFDRSSDEASDEIPNVLNALFGEENTEVYDINLTEKSLQTADERTVGHSKPIRILAFLTTLLVLMLFIFVIAWPSLSKLGWFKGNKPTSIPDKTIVKTEATEAPFDTYVKDFFTSFTAAINEGNLRTDVYPIGSDEVNLYLKLAPIVSFTYETPVLVLSSGNLRTYDVATVFHKENASTVEKIAVDLKFTVKEDGGSYQLQMLKSDYMTAQLSALNETETEIPEPDTDTTDETDKTDQDKPNETTDKTTDEKTDEKVSVPQGFLTKGTFSGGAETSPIEVESIRYGDNVTFQRLVLDLNTASSGSDAPYTSPYTAKISSDATTLTLTLKGVEATKTNTVPIKGVKTISSATANFDSGAQTLTVKLTLTEKGAFKVFNLKAPGRIIIDFVLQP